MRVETYLSQGRMLNQRINYQLKKLGELKSAACSLPAVTIRKFSKQLQIIPLELPECAILQSVFSLQIKLNLAVLSL